MKDEPGEISLLACLTATIWILCLAVGLAGLLARPSPPPPATQSIAPAVETMDTQILVAPPSVPQMAAAAAAPAMAAISLPSSPPAAAAPSPSMAFAVPTPGLVRLAPPSEAGGARADQPAVIAAAQATLTQQEASQPKPDYPFEAEAANQQGSVTIAFTIDSDGRVQDAVVAASCPWPLLNQSALQCVRDQWRFPPGPVRRGRWTFTFQAR